MFFGLLWLTAVIDYCSKFVVIMSASTYYFNHKKGEDDNPDAAEVGFGFKTTYTKHIGSICVGAFVIALVRFIKLCFYYIAKRLETASGENPVAKCAVQCAMCCLNCIERVCDYINEAAFCYMAVTGKSFFPSAWNAFLLHLKHGLKFTFANLIAKIFIFIGKCGIVIGNCFSLLFIMKNITEDTEEVGSVLGPLLVVGVGSYLAASLFLGLFEQAVMVMLTCLCIDMDMHNGEPAYGPPTFHDKLDQMEMTEGASKTNNVV